MAEDSRVESVEPPVRVVLELERTLEPISGFFQVDGQARRPFWGWLELLAALDAIRQRDGATEEEQSPRFFS
jgi:hypothetical protein